MLLKEREWHTCPTCNRNTKIKVEETYGCDTCKKVIDLNKKNEEYLEAIVFNKGEENAVHKQYCSWKCCLKNLRKAKSNYFISLPMLHYDQSKISAKDFFKLVKK